MRNVLNSQIWHLKKKLWQFKLLNEKIVMAVSMVVHMVKSVYVLQSEVQRCFAKARQKRYQRAF